jgi:hypothetical protein
MKSWWELGEHFGFGPSEELALYRIECPFCGEKGNFKYDYRVKKKQANGTKVLHFDTLKCGNCSGYVLVLWSGSTLGGLHSFRVLPYPLKLSSAPDHWPKAVQVGWLEAQRALEGENWNSAAIMSRSAMQAALRGHKATGKDLKEEINDLGEKRLLPPLMVEWSHEVRELGNESTHMEPGDAGTDPQDARDIVEFLDYLLNYLYDLPKKIQEYRDRGAKTGK